MRVWNAYTGSLQVGSQWHARTPGDGTRPRRAAGRPGSAQTLDEVVEVYNTGGVKNPFLSKEIVPLNLSAQEKADLVAFLRSLTGDIAFAVFAPEVPRE